MRILAFDPGVKHLASCCVEESTGSIVSWRVDNIVPGVKKPSIPRVTQDLTALVATMDIEEVGCVRIEQQPTQNIGMKVMSHVLQALFLLRGVPRVDLVSAKTYKMAGGTYNKRKRDSIDRVTHVLTTAGDTEWCTFFSSHAKKDDLADCLLLARHQP